VTVSCDKAARVWDAGSGAEPRLPRPQRPGQTCRRQRRYLR
jgi:hypothetical protein